MNISSTFNKLDKTMQVIIEIDAFDFGNLTAEDMRKQFKEYLRTDVKDVLFDIARAAIADQIAEV
jgi:hypothetical protein